MIDMSKLIRRAAAAAVFFMAVLPTAKAIPPRPQPARLVNDMAGIFTAGQQAALERVLVAFDDSTSNQIAVITVNDLEGYEAAEYATRTGIEWQVGSSEFDNGIVVLVKPKTALSSGEVFIAVGYGLEGAIPDAYAKRIIDTDMIPKFIENDYFGGVAAACSTLMKLASGEISSPREEDQGDWIVAILGIALMILLIVAAILASKNNKGNGGGSGFPGNRRRRIYTGPIIIGGRGPGDSSGGGFGGFGGFGGGSFGGGGAGGKW